MYGYDPTVDQVALAGERAAWISSFQPGHYLYTCIETATIKDPLVRSLGGRCVDETSRFWITAGTGNTAANIVGDGNLLVFNVSSSCVNDENVGPNRRDLIHRFTKGWYALYSGAILRVTPARLRKVASGLGTLYLVSADAGRMLVLRSKPEWGGSSDGADGSLAIYRSDGRLLLDLATGTTLRTWSRRGSSTIARLEDLHAGIVVAVGGRTINLLRVADGKRATVVAPARGLVRGQMEAPGLFYSWTDRDGSGRLQFVSTASLRSRFGK